MQVVAGMNDVKIHPVYEEAVPAFLTGHQDACENYGSQAKPTT